MAMAACGPSSSWRTLSRSIFQISLQGMLLCSLVPVDIIGRYIYTCGERILEALPSRTAQATHALPGNLGGKEARA